MRLHQLILVPFSLPILVRYLRDPELVGLDRATAGPQGSLIQRDANREIHNRMGPRQDVPRPGKIIDAAAGASAYPISERTNPAV